jgi:iron complex outermembrane receptor protein
MTSKVDRSRLPLAAAISTILAAHAQAQDAQRPQLEEVVVTGSLIRGTPEDSALPVKVFSAVELEESGSPSPLEFVKSLPISGPTTGESYYFGSSILTNDVRYNLRGIGRDKTLTLFNGRRAFLNAAVYPAGAIERIEILKDGAAVTYGADATGGVVNIITRESFEGVELSGSYKTYDGSEEGEWKIGATAGFNTQYSNFLFTAEWEHRSELDTSKRRFSSLPYWVNPAPSSNLTNLAGWVPRGEPPAVPTGATAAGEFGPSLLPAFGATLPEGMPVADFTKSSCEAVGGIYENPFRCHYVYIPYYNLVEENDVHRVFAQLTTKISDSADFRFRTLWARNYSPHQYGSPSQPVIRGPARATGATNQLYVPLTNPHAQEFAQRSGWANNPAYADTYGFTAFTYRAFAHGGNDAFAKGDNHSVPNENETKYWHATASVTGDAGWLNYDVGATFNQYKAVNSQPDVMGFRLQEALNGFGGPNCNAPDLDPIRPGTQNQAAAGQNGCLWYNPFSTSFWGQPTLGLPNPNYRPDAENPIELIRWLFNKREYEETRWDFTFDAVFSGETPIALPGGNIAWGLGGQYRTTKIRETVQDPYYNGQTPCDWPGQNPAPTRNPDGTPNPQFTGCTLDEAGPFLFFANNPPDAAQQNQQSYFAEISLPVLDSLNVTVAGRYEKFEPIGLDATVYKVSAKWQIVDQFALRGSYGTNYQAPFVDGTSGRAIIPGDLFNTVASFDRAGGSWLGSQQFTRSDIEPETATVWNAGLIAQFNFGLDQELQLTLDYFNIETKDELGLVATTNDIANAIFSAAAPNLADCSHPLISRVTFNGGGCIQGVTTARDFASIRTDYGNGPGQLVRGIDLQLNYGIGIGPGRLQTTINVTKVLKNETTETILDGFVVKGADDRLGYLNFATVGNAQSEWRGNLNINYSFGDHNIRAVLNYVSGVDDERFLNADGTLNTSAAGLAPAGFQPGTMTPFGITTYGIYGEDWKTADLHYLWRAPWATIGLSVINVSNEDPPASRQEFGFDPRIGNALGRQFEITLRKKF